ncbi:mCG146533, partial [Mus musculus]
RRTKVSSVFGTGRRLLVKP